MKKKKDPTTSLPKDELQKPLKRKNSALERLKRELKIEAALEQVRARTMAMQKSDELAEVSSLLFQQLNSLGVNSYSSGFTIWDNESNDLISWMCNADGSMNPPFRMPIADDDWHARQYESCKNGEDFILNDMAGEMMQSYFRYLRSFPLLDEAFGKSIAGHPMPERQIHNVANFSQGNLLFITPEPCPEAHDIFKRFAKVFEQTYTRFLDLQKAEAQARESQIQLALERVRARTMAMQRSDELAEASFILDSQVRALGIKTRGCAFRADQTQEVWSANTLAEEKIVKAVGIFNINDHPFWQLMYKEWKNKKEFFYYSLAGKDKEDYVKILSATQNYLPQSIQQFPDVHFQVYYFGEGGIWTNSLQPHSEEDKQVMKKFASVFSLTFRRYQDLKKAEEQAREATIEAALEKVRGKAMAMHNSNDLSATANLVFTELRGLGINPVRAGVGLFSKNSSQAIVYTATSSNESNTLALMGSIATSAHPCMEIQYESWSKMEDYFPVLNTRELASYYKVISAQLSVPIPGLGQFKNDEYGCYLPFSEGVLYAWQEKSFDVAEIKILKRFATIIDLTFRRYIELQKSEASARQAIKQATLDRIRADIASMRTIADLDRITPLVWNELNILGVPFIRCGVFIMDDSQQLIHTFLSTPDGKGIAAFHIPYSTPGNIGHLLSHWQDKKNYIAHWDEDAFTDFAHTLVKQGALASPEQYLKTLPPGGFYLHCLPFLQGMLYVGNTTQLGEDEIKLLQSIADAFSTAYARYEDFNKLEAAKEQVDKTLVDLKQAQVQLVQSEKMASLGELTAGIAHEIQNPLNFVNNFSEVNKELMEELKDEADKGNIEEVKSIANDVIENSEKINHHGMRADAIVKSMLQHSRKSEGVKEPTGINALADEYLRLSYHGMRAKDKSFNADFKTEFNENIVKINMVPQDIARVLLNLINNAFYATNEKKKIADENYKPLVSVQTKKINDKVEISVSDNGNGIPQNIVEKIFQPFFTTKPTGQGTGLGLSLAYDVVKAHGGELKVKTKEGEGTEFIIQLPVV